MLKFIKHNMETIGGIEIYPIISFLIFFLFFILVTVLVFKKDRKYIEKMANMPLDKDSNNRKTNIKPENHEKS